MIIVLATALARTAGKLHHNLELGHPKAEDATSDRRVKKGTLSLTLAGMHELTGSFETFAKMPGGDQTTLGCEVKSSMPATADRDGLSYDHDFRLTVEG
jgi:hypothetical protein